MTGKSLNSLFNHTQPPVIGGHRTFATQYEMMKIRRGFLIFGAVSVPVLTALLIWRMKADVYRAPGGDTYSRIREAILIINELPDDGVPEEETQLLALVKSKWPTTRDDGPIDGQLLDGWGHPLSFTFHAVTRSWNIVSADRDGKFGTGDDTASESIQREIKKGEQAVSPNGP